MHQIPKHLNKELSSNIGKTDTTSSSVNTEEVDSPTDSSSLLSVISTESSSLSKDQPLRDSSTIALNGSDKRMMTSKKESTEATNGMPKPVHPAPLDQTRSSTSISSSTSSLVTPPHVAMKVIKGEIHNVMNTLRTEEHSRRNSTATDHHHARTRLMEDLVMLQERLNEYVYNGRNVTNENDQLLLPPPMIYLQPFCEAVTERALSATVTGAALAALHKFLLYGFLGGSDNSEGVFESHCEGMTYIAQALLNCSFEESDDAAVPDSSVVAGVGQASQPGSSSAASLYKRVSSSSQAFYSRQQEEQVVLKLLELSALVVRCALSSKVHLLESSYLTGLLDTCLHVCHRAQRASHLLKSAASNAMSQIVLQVFANERLVQPARREMLQTIVNLCQPRGQQDLSVTISALTAVNIALETCREPLIDEEITILQNELCKYLLQWTTSRDLMILSLVLRVIFNLFQSIRNHLKVPLEVFLTSVHLRLVETDKSTVDEKEIALESLLEFCQEPLLMQDLYLNYDCDVACSNLYEMIVATLGRLALPVPEEFEHVVSSTQSTMVPSTSSTSGKNNGGLANPTLPSGSSLQSQLTSAVYPGTSSNLLNRYAVDALLAVLNSIEKRCKAAPFAETVGKNSFGGVTEDEDLDETTRHVESLSQVSDKELHERRQRKQNLSNVAKAFNDNPYKVVWLDMAVEHGLLDQRDNVEGVAELLYSAPGVDKVKLGEYLSKGPEKDWPFNTRVRQSFIGLYDFSGMTFANALRKFLSKFRLPGEAQCIDRFMGSFSKELYEQCAEDTIFRNSDAIYVLAFSTIMLNTDLHNPTIREENRMTLDQFVKNNRGINDGQDFPREYLENLYFEIKGREIQVRREIGELMKHHESEDFRSAWDNLLTKSREVATPFFSPVGSSEENGSRSVVHDREMFIHLANAAVKGFSGVLLYSEEDDLVSKVVSGLRLVVKIGAFFDLDDVVDAAMQELLPLARDYIVTAIAEGAMNADGIFTFTVAEHSSRDDDSEGDGTVSSEYGVPLPLGVLISGGKENCYDASGSAAHRGLLAFDCSFFLMKKYCTRVSSAWPLYIECLCALRDAKALPPGLADLDDFADSNGDVLPLSSYAVSSKKRIDEYYRQINDPSVNKTKSWLGSFFGRSKPISTVSEDAESALDDSSVAASKAQVSLIIKALRRVAVSSEIENVVQMSSISAEAAVKTVVSLLETVQDYPYNEDPVQEQNAVFSLEIATRSLLSNREHAEKIFFMFLNTFEAVLGKVSEKDLLAPFILERIVVTVLRCSIHLYDIEELRPTLRASLHLIFMSLPRYFIKNICDRIACGLAIILRSSYHLMETPNEWAFMGDTLDMLANQSAARIFVFDGIASTVEYAIPGEGSTNGAPPLSKEASSALSKILIRFVLGFYQNDVRLSVPAMLALEKLYHYRVYQKVTASDKYEKGTDPLTVVPDREAWQNLTVALYSVARSSDPEVSRHGTGCFKRVVLRTSMDQISEEKWIAILYLMVNKQPPTGADVSRSNVFCLLGEMLAKTLPILSKDPENLEDLSDLITQVANLAGENLRTGRRGTSSILFEKTLQSVTELSNHMQSQSESWGGDKEFIEWASETLIHELEKVGAAGAAYKNQQAVQAKQISKGEEDDKRETNETSVE